MILFSWEDYFTTTVPISIQNERVTFSTYPCSIYIYNSQFDGLSANLGGAIYIEVTEQYGTKAVFEGLIFTNCVAKGDDGWGGSIYFNCNGACICTKICGSHSDADLLGTFAYLQGKFEDDGKCNVFYTSVIDCLSETDYGQWTITMNAGFLATKELNMSTIYGESDPAQYFSPAVNGNDETSYIRYSSFSNITAQSYNIHVVLEDTTLSSQFPDKHTNVIMDSCNFIKNDVLRPSYGFQQILQSDNSNLHIIGCCFIENKQPLFSIDNDGHIYVENCSFVDNDCSPEDSLTDAISWDSKTLEFFNEITFIDENVCKDNEKFDKYEEFEHFNRVDFYGNRLCYTLDIYSPFFKLPLFLYDMFYGK